jgi:hypothetical protein
MPRPILKLTGHFMGQLRTANKRHNRAIVALNARKKLAKAEAETKRPARASAKAAS